MKKRYLLHISEKKLNNFKKSTEQTKMREIAFSKPKMVYSLDLGYLLMKTILIYKRFY